MTSMWTVLDTMWWFDVVVVASPHWLSSRRIRGCSVDRRWDNGLSRVIYFYYYRTQSSAGLKIRLTPMWTVLDTMWWLDVVVVASPHWPSSRRIRGCSVDRRWDNGLSRV